MEGNDFITKYNAFALKNNSIKTFIVLKQHRLNINDEKITKKIVIIPSLNEEKYLKEHNILPNAEILSVIFKGNLIDAIDSKLVYKYPKKYHLDDTIYRNYALTLEEEKILKGYNQYISCLNHCWATVLKAIGRKKGTILLLKEVEKI